MKHPVPRIAIAAMATISVLLLLVFLLFDLFLPRFINLAELKAKIETSINQSTGIRAEIEKISIKPTLLNGFEVTFNNNILFDPADVEVVRSGNIHVNVRYLPLFRKKTSISRITFDDISVYIGESSFLFRLKRPKTESEDVVVEDAEIALNRYNIVIDRYFDSLNQYRLQGKRLSLRHVKSWQPVQLLGDGAGYFGVYNKHRLIGTFKLYGHGAQALLEKPRLDWKDVHRLKLQVNGVNLSTLSTMVKSYGLPLTAQGNLNELILEISGRKSPKVLQFQGQTRERARISLAPYRFEFEPGRLILRTHFHVNPEKGRANLDKLLLQLHSRKVDIRLDGWMHLVQPFERSVVQLSGKTNWLPVRTLEFIPGLPPHLRRLLSGTRGDIASRIKIQGPVANPATDGIIELRHLSVRSPRNKRWLAWDLSGKFHVQWPDLQVQVDRLQGEVAGGDALALARLNRKADMLQGRAVIRHLDLARLQQLVLLFRPDWSALSKVRVNGRTDMVLDAKGKLSEPDLNGNIDLHSVSLVGVKSEKPELNGFTGRLHLAERRITTSNLAGQIEQSRVRLQGGLNLAQSSWDLVVHSRDMSLASVQRLLWLLSDATGRPAALLRQWQAQGQTDFNVSVIGALSRPDVIGQVRLERGRLANRERSLALSDMNGVLQLHPGRVEIQRLTAALNQTRLALGGGVSQQFRQLNLTLDAPDADLADVRRLVAQAAPQLYPAVKLSGHADIRLALNGPVSQPESTGFVRFRQARIEDSDRDMVVQGIQGLVRLTANDIRLESLSAVMDGIPFRLQGMLGRTLQQYRLNLIADNVPLTRVQSVFVPRLPEASRTALAPLSIVGGLGDINLIIASDLPNRLAGTVRVEGVKARMSNRDIPGMNGLVGIRQLTYNLGTGRIDSPAGALQFGKLAFNLSGVATQKGYRIRVVSRRTPVAVLRDNRAALQQWVPVTLPVLFNTAGDFQLDALLTPKNNHATLRFYNAGASVKELPYPVYNLNGTLALGQGKSGLQASADNLSLRYANSPMKLNFDIDGLKDMYIEATGTLSPLVLNKLLLNAKSTLVAYAAVPFEVNLSGSLGQLAGTGLGNNLHLFVNFNVASLFDKPTLERPEQPGDASLNQANLSSVMHLMGDTLKIEQTRFKVDENSSLSLEGQIFNLFRPNHREALLTVLTEPVLDLAALARNLNLEISNGLDGKLGLDLKFNSLGNQLSVNGTATFDHVKSSTLEVSDLHGKITFDQLKAFLDIAHFQIPGVDVGFTARIADLAQYPLPVEDLDVTGSQFIVSLYTEWMNRIIIGKLRQGFWEQFFPNTGRVGTLPFEVKNGTLQLAEGIINNLIVTHYSSDVRVYPNTYFELGNIQADSAGGHATGYFAMNPRLNNFMSVHLDIDKMKANAVSRILLNVSNEIFGDLSGVIDYTTEGMTPEEMFANANGSASLKVSDGRLPSIAKIQNLLVAANTISGGLANLNLNSFLRLADPFRTEYFAELSGTFKIVQGIISTQDMVSDGKNLDLWIAGDIQMANAMADLKIRGRMDREIGGILGPLGDLSVSRFLGIIPPLRVLISHIPGLGFVPGFGGPRADKGVAFEVRMDGPVLDPGSIQGFKWIK